MKKKGKGPLDADVLQVMEEMTDAQQNALLLELSQTAYWPAIQRYLQTRSHVAQNALYTLDPFKEPTQTARFQGMLVGLSDITEAVGILSKKSRPVENEDKEEVNEE